jgi:hypothetical protein
MTSQAALLRGLVVWFALASTIAARQDGRQPPPLEVEFSSPVEGEADVRLDAIVRVQFSRDVDRTSLDKRIRLQYSKEESAERGEAQPPSITFSLRYQRDTRAIEITPSRPLERFRHVTVELLEGITGADGSVLSAWRLQFSTGGS